MKSKTKKIVLTGMLAAIAFILQFIGSVMNLTVGGFLEIEFSDLPAVIGTLAMGPVYGVVIEFIKNLLHTAMTTTGLVGEFANFVINGIYVLVIGVVYKLNKTKKGAIISLAAGILAIAVSGALANLYIMLPLYASAMPFAAKLNMVLTVITPFNIVKAIVIGGITLIIYKKISPVFKV